jgi:predicted  nucleic acid-binding Zn-ribbon protein
MELADLEKKIETLTLLNAELLQFKQDYFSAKQSLNRMSARLKKLCKKLEPHNDSVIEMQKLASEIREFVLKAT